MVAAYSQPDRADHNLNHIAHVLQTIATLQPQAHNLAALQLAAWFHDIVYNSQATDNETQSAINAENVLRSLGLPPATITTVQELILATNHHSDRTNSSIDRCILLDADLAILGTTPQQYWQYAQAIRQEYAWVSDRDYRNGRKRILSNFLQRDRLYLTDTMHQTHTARARQNLQAELHQLDP